MVKITAREIIYGIINFFISDRLYFGFENMPKSTYPSNPQTLPILNKDCFKKLANKVNSIVKQRNAIVTK